MYILTAVTTAMLAASPTGETANPSAPDLMALATARYRFSPSHDNASPDAIALAQTTLPDSALPSTTHQPFGAIGSKYWFISAAGGTDLKETEETLARIGGGYSYFVADGFSFDFELNGMYFGQPENDAFGINFNFLMRWHFWQNEARTVSIYADAGAGLLYCTEDVPDDGERFNFTPQAGMGMSFDVGSGGNDLRLFTGVRWHHVSNARIFESNPGTDMAMFYAMLSWPF